MTFGQGNLWEGFLGISCDSALWVCTYVHRVAVVGNVDAGKSTLLGVLTHGELDNGRGTARQRLFRHKHEMETGRTSSVGNDILGFDGNGEVVNKTDGHGECQYRSHNTELSNHTTLSEIVPLFFVSISGWVFPSIKRPLLPVFPP